MFRVMHYCVAVLAIYALQSFAVDVRADTRFSSGGHSWSEGTISTVGNDGKFTIRGSTSPYATTYSTYHHGYYSTPEANRKIYVDGYRDKFGYKWSDENVKEYTYTVPGHTTFSVYDEPNYGNDFSTWKYSSEPKTYKYSDLKSGDRVVVGYTTDGRVGHVYRVNPNK